MTFQGGIAENAKILASTGNLLFIKKSIFKNVTAYFGGGLSLEGIGGDVTLRNQPSRTTLHI
jgi:hypothetical protein